MTDDGFGVLADRPPASQAEMVAKWDAQQTEKRRAAAEAAEEFRRTIFQPLWEQAEQAIATVRDALSVPFVSDWLRASAAQQLLDARYAARASAQLLDEAAVRAAIRQWVETTTAIYDEFARVLEARRCKVCGSPSACAHDAPAPGGAAEALYPATPIRLRRPTD